MDTRPCTFQILAKYYVKVLSMNDYIKGTVSSGRFERISQTARENEALQTLLNTTYVCFNPTLAMTDEDGLDYPSNARISEDCTQSEVSCPAKVSFQVVQHVLNILLSRRGKSNNVLCQGYTKVIFAISKGLS